MSIIFNAYIKELGVSYQQMVLLLGVLKKCQLFFMHT